MSDRIRCACRRCTIRGLMGPAVIITNGGSTVNSRSSYCAGDATKSVPWPRAGTIELHGQSPTAWQLNLLWPGSDLFRPAAFAGQLSDFEHRTGAWTLVAAHLD